MKKQFQAPARAGTLQLLAVREFCERHRPADPGRQVLVGHRPSSTMELRLFAQAWNMPVRDAVEVLVYVRSWLHNLILGGATSSYHLDKAEVDVLARYAVWLDGLPQVVKRLPDEVLLQEPVCAPLRLSVDLPPEFCRQQVGAPIERPNEEAAVIPLNDLVKVASKKAHSNAQRRARERRLGASFVQSSSAIALPVKGTSKGRSASMGRR